MRACVCILFLLEREKKRDISYIEHLLHENSTECVFILIHSQIIMCRSGINKFV